jgi:hypothetical protein
MHRRQLHILTVMLVFGCVHGTEAGAVPVLPDFQAATFDPAQVIDNPFFPLTFTGTRVYANTDGSGDRFELTNVGPGPVILGVQVQAQRDRDFEDGLLVEETFDYYAQDTDGNVWYMGEDVTNFVYDDEGNLIDTNSESAWRAGVNGASPGFIMPTDPQLGFNYFQEFAPNDDALDQGTIFAFLDEVELEAGVFEDVLQVLETTELDPDAREFKYFARGFGLILAEEDLDENFENPEARLELSAAQSVPEPGTLALLSLGLLAIAVSRRRRT